MITLSYDSLEKLLEDVQRLQSAFNLPVVHNVPEVIETPAEDVTRAKAEKNTKAKKYTRTMCEEGFPEDWKSISQHAMRHHKSWYWADLRDHTSDTKYKAAYEAWLTSLKVNDKNGREVTTTVSLQQRSPGRGAAAIVFTPSWKEKGKTKYATVPIKSMYTMKAAIRGNAVTPDDVSKIQDYQDDRIQLGV